LGEAVPVIALRSSQSEAGRRRAGTANFSSSGRSHVKTSIDEAAVPCEAHSAERGARNSPA